MRLTTSLAAALALSLAPAIALAACPDLPTPQEPKVEKCSFYDLACKARNRDRKDWHERQVKGFNLSLAYDSQGLFSAGDKQPRVDVVDSLVGCRGESVRMTFRAANSMRVEYQLRAPSGVAIASGSKSLEANDAFEERSIILTESGTYRLTVRTTQGAAKELTDKNGKRLGTYYPREYAVGFRSDGQADACRPGDQLDGTTVEGQPFRRRFALKAGERGRVQLTSSTGDFVAVVLAASGRELSRSGPTRAWDSPAVTPSEDEELTIDARPARGAEPVGIRLVCDGGGLAEGPLELDVPFESSFRLPAAFDSARSSAHAETSRRETVRRELAIDAPGQYALTVTPSALRGLVVRVLVYDKSERIALEQRVGPAEAVLPLTIPSRGNWTVEITPVAARRLSEDGEVRYSVTFSRANDAPAPTAEPSARGRGTPLAPASPRTPPRAGQGRPAIGRP